MKRRSFLAIGAVIPFLSRPAQAGKGTFPVTRSDAEWRARLTSAEYKVLRKHGTERAYSSPLNAEKRPGVFGCKGCDQPLYKARDKFDSGTGWPSFTQSIKGAIGTSTDRRFLMVRTECHCSNCGSHLGHIFNDGPAPTGKRHCINGVALTFVPA